MQSIGEAMAIGRTFPEALQKGIRSLESGRFGLNGDPGEREPPDRCVRAAGAWSRTPTTRRIFAVEAALRSGATVSRKSTRPARIDPWFLDRIVEIIEMRAEDRGRRRERCRRARSSGSPTPRSRTSPDRTEQEVRAESAQCGPCTKASTRARPSSRPTRRTTTRPTKKRTKPSPNPGNSVMILGSGPNRIGQGIEFDYCCVHAAFALEDVGLDAVMVNCNPETVSTDYDTSTRLYFEPLDARGRSAHRRDREAEGCDRPARGPDAAAAGARPRSGRRADPRHLAGRHRHRRGPRTVRRADREAAASRTRRTERRLHCDEALEISRRIGYPVLASSELRARWTRDGDRLLRRDAASATSQARPSRVPTVRSSSTSSWRTRSRSTSMRSTTASELLRRRDPRAHRGGRCAFGRLGVRHAAAHAERRAHRDASSTTRSRSGRGARCSRTDERPVRRARRRGLRHRSEPARVAHGPVLLEGHRRPAGEGRDVGAWSDTRSTSCASADCSSETAAHPGLPFTAVKEAVLPWGRFPGVDIDPRPGDAIDRRSHGYRRRLRHALSRKRRTPPARSCRRSRRDLHLAARSGQGCDHPRRRRLVELGFEIYSTVGTAEAAARRTASPPQPLRRSTRASRTSSIS